MMINLLLATAIATPAGQIEYTPEQRIQLAESLQIPPDQARIPAGHAGAIFGVLPACRDLAAIPIDGGISFQSPHPDGGEPVVWFDWIAPSNPYSKEQGIAAISAYGVCKQGGVSIPLYPLPEALKLLESPVAGEDKTLGYAFGGIGALLTLAGGFQLTQKGAKEDQGKIDLLEDL